MERLPDELWLLVFTYLHQYDILYLFNNLNLRFDKMIRPFASMINLTDLSYKLFTRFRQEILPIDGHHIHHLIIKDIHQLNFFRENSKLLAQINRLQCLTLIEPKWLNELTSFYLQHLPSLNSLHLKLSTDSGEKLENILSNQLTLLTDLNLLHESGGSGYFFHNVPADFYLPRLKTLTIQNLKTSKDISYLFKIMCNVEEMNLSVNQFDYQPFLNYIIPKSLTTLKLQLTCTIENQQTIELIREFLFLFKMQLKSLELVINSTEKQFAIELQETLTMSLPNLLSFDCFVEILDPPARQLPAEAMVGDYISAITTCLFPTLTLQQLKNRTAVYVDTDTRYDELGSLIIPDDILLPKLRKIYFDVKFSNPNFDTEPIYSKLLSISRNLTMLSVNHSNSMLTIDLLKNLPRQTKLMIKTLDCRNSYKGCAYEFHPTFLQELSPILPKLRYLNLHTIMPTANATEKVLTPKLAMHQARKYLKNLIHLCINLNVSDLYYWNENNAKMITQKMTEELQEYLKDDQYKNLFFKSKFDRNELYILDFWL